MQYAEEEQPAQEAPAAVAMLVSDQIRMVKSDSVPLLPVQIEVVKADCDFELGLNDIMYILPSFAPKQYRQLYPQHISALTNPVFNAFFSKFVNYKDEEVPQKLVDLDKAHCTAIEQDLAYPHLRGQAYINVKGLPNGEYEIYYIRISQPIGIHSQLKVLGKTPNVRINFDRTLLNDSHQP